MYVPFKDGRRPGGIILRSRHQARSLIENGDQAILVFGTAVITKEDRQLLFDKK